jgi:hypothetical protein
MFPTNFAGLVALAAVGFSTGAEAVRAPVTATAASLTSPTILPPNVLKNLLEKGGKKSDPVDCPICSRPSRGTTASSHPATSHTEPR